MRKERFLKVTDGDHEFLLASAAAVAIKARDALEFNRTEGGSVVAWLDSGGGVRWPVIRLCQLLGIVAGEWGNAVFLRTGLHTVGVAAENVQLAAESDSGHAKPFSMIGAVNPGAPLYCGVYVEPQRSALILDGAGIAEQVARHVGLS